MSDARENFQDPTAYCNTWGDAIIAFFDSVGDGLDYALTLRGLPDPSALNRLVRRPRPGQRFVTFSPSRPLEL